MALCSILLIIKEVIIPILFIEIYFLVEGYIDGKLVATHKVVPARRPSKVLLWLDNEGKELVADGSDFVTVIAAIADDNGTVKRLNDFRIKFEVEGEGRLLGNSSEICNPAIVRWGTVLFCCNLW